LHWAARNGHLPVVKYLACECEVDLEAATIDGTTAFCWACWQGHQNIME
jgi:ankyrin repeat protein